MAYRKSAPNGSGKSSTTTRELAALDFLLNIPLDAEQEIVRAGLEAEQNSILTNAGGGGFSNVIYNDRSYSLDEDEKFELETLKRGDSDHTNDNEYHDSPFKFSAAAVGNAHTGSSENDDHTTPWWHDMIRKNKEFFSAEYERIKRREQEQLELETGMLGGTDESDALSAMSSRTKSSKDEGDKPNCMGERIFYSAKYVMPSRDWRGVSYRALLPRVARKNTAFNRMIKQGRNDAIKKCEERLRRKKRREKQNLQKIMQESDVNIDNFSSDSSYESNGMSINDSQSSEFSLFENEMPHVVGKTSQHEDDDSSSYISSSSEDSITYDPGFLDDPEMVLARQVGDRGSGGVVSSLMHFVNPVDLKDNLNEQFSDRFKQWEPPKPHRKYIGARVIEGCYTLIDPTESTIQQEDNDLKTSDDEGAATRRKRKSSITYETETIRMPPSLTLSKIRKLKQQALYACIERNIEVSTVALACVYFERLALDCRVDKSNRRLTFAACLLISIKTNEANTALVHEHSNESANKSKKGVGVLKSWIKSRVKGDDFDSVLEFFTHEWSLSLKELFAAEFGVFAALNFKLHATPSQVSFHFKSLMKMLQWSPKDYLGRQMYEQWQQCLSQEYLEVNEKEQRREERKQREEQKLLKLQHELHTTEETHNDDPPQPLHKISDSCESSCDLKQVEELNESATTETATHPRKKLGLFNRLRFTHSQNNLNNLVSSHEAEALSDNNPSNGEPKSIEPEVRTSRPKSVERLKKTLLLFNNSD